MNPPEPDWDAEYKARLEGEPSDPKELARILLALGELGKRVQAADTDLRQRYADRADPGDRTGWRVGDQAVGTVAVVNGRQYARVSDLPTLLAWVTAHHPTEVEQVPTVRAAFLRKLIAAVAEDGGLPDPATGEAVPVPGITVETGPPHVRVVPAKGSGALIEAEWAAGRLVLPGSVLPPRSLDAAALAPEASGGIA